jgi:GTP-binding protein
MASDGDITAGTAAGTPASGEVIALIGRPNVGKSTLFNVLTQSRDALVADYPGLTRDRIYGRFEYQGQHHILIDTGGLSGEDEAIDEHMEKQTRLAVEESTIVLFLVDGRAGLTPADETVAESLRRTGKTVVLVVNKTDGLDQRSAESDFYSLGLGQPISIAASHKRGVQALLAAVLPETGVAETELSGKSLQADTETGQESLEQSGIRVAIIGRPNVGKSTLVNRFLGEERVVVFDMPGTTRDSVEVPFERDGKRYTFIDTAGIRRKRAVSDAIEKFSIIKSMQAIEQSNVVIMMIDARTEIADQDLHLIGYVLDAGKALVIAINKWDGMDEYQKQLIHKGIDKQLPFVSFAEMFFISALHGSGVGDLYGAIDRAYASAMQHYSTPDLTRLLEKAVQSHQPPMINGRRIKLRYAHQGGINPPRIVIHGNQVTRVPAMYQRYLTNFFRKALKSVGTPILIEFKNSNKNPFKSRKNPAKKPK